MHIIIPGEVIAKKNSKQIFCRGRFPVVIPSKAYETWHQSAQNALRGTKRVEGVQSIEVTFYRRTEAKYDLSNMLESVMDLLVDAGVIEDDNIRVVPKVTAIHGGKDSLNPRAEVLIHTPPLPYRDLEP